MNNIVDKNDINYIFTCTKCKIPKLNSDFYQVNRNNLIRKYQSICKKCSNENITERVKLFGIPNKAKTAKKWNDSHKLERKQFTIEHKKKKPILYMISTAKFNAKKRNISFNITSEMIEKLLISQNNTCFYTGRPLKLELGFDDSMSIDRVNSSIGYEEYNIVLCQYKVNIMKNNASIDELLAFCSDILNNFK